MTRAFSIINTRTHALLATVQASSRVEATETYGRSIGLSLDDMLSSSFDHVFAAPALTLAEARELCTTRAHGALRYLSFETPSEQGSALVETRAGKGLYDVDYIVDVLSHEGLLELEVGGYTWRLYFGLAGDQREWLASEFRDSLPATWTMPAHSSRCVGEVEATA